MPRVWKRWTCAYPPGAQTGSRVRVAGRGNAGMHGGAPGDLYIVMKVEPHHYFERRGDDLYTVVPITVPKRRSAQR